MAVYGHNNYDPQQIQAEADTVQQLLSDIQTLKHELEN